MDLFLALGKQHQKPKNVTSTPKNTECIKNKKAKIPNPNSKSANFAHKYSNSKTQFLPTNI